MAATSGRDMTGCGASYGEAGVNEQTPSGCPRAPLGEARRPAGYGRSTLHARTTQLLHSRRPGRRCSRVLTSPGARPRTQWDGEWVNGNEGTRCLAWEPHLGRGCGAVRRGRSLCVRRTVGWRQWVGAPGQQPEQPRLRRRSARAAGRSMMQHTPFGVRRRRSASRACTACPGKLARGCGTPGGRS